MLGFEGYTFTPDTLEPLLEHVAELRNFISQWSWLADMHIVDFFVEEHWNQLPGPWRASFRDGWSDASDTTAVEQLVDLAVSNQLWPTATTELHEFVARCHALSLERRAKTDPTSSTPVVVPALDDRITLGMNPKKAVEVQHLAYIIASLNKSQGIKLVADIGAGQGYLSRTLAYQYGQTTIAMDSDQLQTCGAERQRQLTERMVHHRGDHLSGSPASPMVSWTGQPVYLDHLTCLIDTDHLPDVHRQLSRTYHQLVHSPLDAQVPDTYLPPWTICGLHACGQLSNVMLQWFVRSSARCLVNVGCCYNMLGFTQGLMSDVSTRFPISEYLSKKSARLSVNALKLACQSPARWANDTQTSIGNFERNFYRALIHYMMVDQGLVKRDDPFPVLGRLPKSAFRDFQTYCQRAFQRLGMSPLDSDLVQEYYDRFRPRAIQMAIVWTLKALLSPCIESFIVLDRCLYLVEQGCHVSLVPLVDVTISPRNLTIVATKPSVN
ncbi:hypothetical protein IWQ62_000719 [Dispira parvispora]|uniref:Methyltransferase domain-containing protein n=1 Tax=Dispira parvispora TaxID=1520584 RepID=A0A9W8E8X6_9FUNG|nr:hypothetical protein IWQ62_000719 [Dispira parvispora]